MGIILFESAPYSDMLLILRILFSLYNSLYLYIIDSAY